MTSILVTGGTGFIGAALVHRLLEDGHRVRVLDNLWRSSQTRLADIAGDLEFVEDDIRDYAAVEAAAKGVEAVYHLAYINGTEFFYSQPELVLDVAVKGMINVLDACQKWGIGELMLASSSEVYQTPPQVPTDEAVPLVVPNVMNPRYSYGGGKIISELLAVNFGRKNFDRVTIFRPHNVYGPDMGWDHVLPQFVLRMKDIVNANPENPVSFPIHGDGTQTRSFVYIDDMVDGIMTIMNSGEHLNVYHVGTNEEVSMAILAGMVGAFYGRNVEVAAGPPIKGETPRRCPDISKMKALGYAPRVKLKDGLPLLAEWYDANAHMAPEA